MNTKFDHQSSLGRVLEKICEIAEKSTNGDYIFRGEPKFYPEVASSLYRQYQGDIDIDDFDIRIVQTEILNEAKEYTDKTDEFEILCELQHFGGKTNLIDFTTDYLIALFFACDGVQGEPGRVILLKKESEDYEIKKSGNLRDLQKTVFVQSVKGFIQPGAYDVVSISEDLKEDVLDYLRRHHDISTKTIYTDLHGFIKNQGLHRSVYTEYHRGLTSQNRGTATQNRPEKQVWYEKAIVHYTDALELKPDFPEGYHNRGLVYFDAGEFERAIQDFNRAIELNPVSAPAYNNRGIVYSKKGDFDRAIRDYSKVISLKPDLLDGYNNRGIAYRERGDFDKAIQDFDTVIALDPNNAFVYNSRGNIYSKKGDFDRAIQDYDRAIQLNPNDAIFYGNRGNAYSKKGDFDRAIQDYDRAIKLNPNDAISYTNRGEVWLHLKEWEKAKGDLTFARDNGVNIVTSFHNDYESVEDFEKKNDIQLPENIAAMLKDG